MEINLLYVPAKDVDEARRIGRALVEERLAGCINIISRLQSIYRWEDAVTEDTETLLLVKTPCELTAEATARIRALHSYQVPCIGVVRMDLNADYGRWLIGSPL